jgi:hypothetical protein
MAVGSLVELLSAPIRWRGGRCDRCHYLDVQWRWHGDRLCDNCLHELRLEPPPALADVTLARPEPQPRDHLGRYRSRRPPADPPLT